MKKTMIAFTIINVISLIAVWSLYPVWSTRPPEMPMQSVMDKQQELVDLGYEIAVDGKLGPDTQQAWDSAWDNENFGNEVYNYE